MTKRAHKRRHIKLHKFLDELLADFMLHSEGPILQRTIQELMQWSFDQTVEPVEKSGAIR